MIPQKIVKKFLLLIWFLIFLSVRPVLTKERSFGLDEIECSTSISIIAYVTIASTEFQLRHPSNILKCKITPKLIYNLLEITNQSRIKVLNRPLGQKSQNKIVGILSLANSDIGMNKKLDLLELLTIPTVHPLIHKNEESVLLQVHPSKLHVFKQILFSKLGRKLKYKAVFGWNELKKLSDNELYVSENSMQPFYSSCVFCFSSQTLIPLKHIPSMEADKWIDYQKNFHQSKLRISTPPAGRPRLNYTLGLDGKYKMQNGLLTYVLRYAQKKLNFSIELRPTSGGGGTGIKFPNGTWNGVISDVLYGHADIGMITAETYSRAKVLGFTRGFVVESVVLVTAPPTRIFTWKSIFWPLKPTAWAFLIAAISISVLMIKSSFLVLSEGNEDNCWGILDTTEFILKTLLNQSTLVPRRSSVTLKIYIAVWLLCGSIITTAYLSKLVGFLTFPVLEKAPQTAQELGESSDYSWALTYLGGAAHAIIKATKSKSYEKIYSKLELATDFVKCLTRTLESKFVCFSYQTVPKFYLNNRIDLQPGESPFLIAPVPLLSLPVGMSMEKRAVFSPNFDDFVRRLETTGLIPIWEQMDFRNIRKAKLESVRGSDLNRWRKRIDGEKDKSLLTLNHFKGAFVILLFGSLVSIAIMIWELLIMAKPISI